MRLPWGRHTKPGRPSDGTADLAAGRAGGSDRRDPEPLVQAQAGTSADLSRAALLEGAGDHAGAGRPDGRWAAGDPGPADPGDAGAAPAVVARWAVPVAPDVGAAAERPARSPAGADRLPGAVPGRPDRPVGRRRPC